MKKLSCLVKHYRQKMGMTQRALSIKTGITQETISNIETGRITNPQSKTILKFAKIFGVTPDTLFGLK